MKLERAQKEAEGQVLDAKDTRSLSCRPDRVAESQMLQSGTALQQNTHVLGHVPGIAVNDS